jgi:two-component system probable response regulator PhcQ
MSAYAVVLLVDDEPYALEALKRALRHERYEFLTATSGEGALNILKIEHVDVVISDEQMPGMSGVELLSIVRQQFPRTIRMILSGQASLEAALRAIDEGGVHRFFIKPCDPTYLAITIRHAVEHQRLREHSRRLPGSQRQAALLARLEDRESALLRVDTDEHGAVLVNDADVEVDMNELLVQIDSAVQRR